MPNRILKESVCASDTIDRLSWFEEVLFYRLIVNCDDFGRFDGRPQYIKNRLFPLKENLTNKAVSTALDSLANAGLVVLYEFEGKPFLYLPTWNAHQSIRAKKSKYPDPADCVASHESICKQMQANVTVIQSNTKSNTNNSTEPQAPSVLTLTLNDGSEFPITQADIDEWQKVYPGADVYQQLLQMQLWCKDNPKKRKTKTGIRRFVTNWLDREQNRGGYKPNVPQQPTQTLRPKEWKPSEPTPEEMERIRQNWAE